MPVTHISRSADLKLSQRARPGSVPIRVDSDTDTLKFGTGSSGTTEKEAVDTSSAQSISGKTFTGVPATSPNVIAVEATFTETSGAGTYTAPVVLPAGATLLDIVINGVALWNASGACTLKVGDTDDDGYFTGVDLKATDLLAGESLSFSFAGGKAGAYIANAQVSPRYSATARTINGIVSAAGTAGTTGRTRMTVYYTVSATADVIAATKV